MAEKIQKTLPKFDSIEDLVEFFDENDLGDYLENMPEVEFEVNLQKETDKNERNTK